MERNLFTIEIKETLSKIIEINAESLDAAILKVKEKYQREEIVLSSEDFVTAEIEEYSK